MCPRDDRLYDEAAALWRELYALPPPREADGRAILELILREMPGAEYGRLVSPYLRPANIVFPQR